MVQSRAPLGLIVENMLFIHTLVVGNGYRLFANGFPPNTFELADPTPTTIGVIIATYQFQPSGRSQPGT